MANHLKVGGILWLQMMQAQPEDPVHRAPEGVETVQDTPEVTERRIAAGYVMMPGFEEVPIETPAIRCATCPWYQMEGALCSHPKNNFQCNGPEGCCNRWENLGAVMWNSQEQLAAPGWVTDHDAWENAKDDVDPEGKGRKYRNPWAVTTKIYKERKKAF